MFYAMVPFCVLPLHTVEYFLIPLPLGPNFRFSDKKVPLFLTPFHSQPLTNKKRLLYAEIWIQQYLLYEQLALIAQMMKIHHSYFLYTSEFGK